LANRRNWGVLRQAGLLWAEDSQGDSILVEDGRLVAAWGPGEQPPLEAAQSAGSALDHVPPTVAAAEEARLIWKWLDRPGVCIIESTNPLMTSRHPVPNLTSLAG
jgi:hypothetical protein